jgi:hypothetical protein
VPVVILSTYTSMTATEQRRPPVARQLRLERVFGAIGDVPAMRTVPDLGVALGLVRRLGGSVVSETRTAPGIGSWAFVSDNDGSELLLWQSST